jgi:hypothetical protein
MASHIGGGDRRTVGGGDAHAGGGARAVTPPGRGCTGCGASGRGGALMLGAGGALEGRAQSIPDPRLQRPGVRAGGIRADRWGHKSKSVT